MSYLIIFLAIIIPYIATNKKIALRCSFTLLFIIWGLQYDMVNDWSMNLNRWNAVNYNEIIYRDVEPLLAYLMSLAKPITFFGWLMVCAIFELGTIYYFTRKYVQPKYYWLTIFILMLRIDYGLLFINSNRQTLSVIFSMYAVLFLLMGESNKTKKIKNIPILNLLISLLILFAATQIHSAAILSYLIIPIYLFIKFIPNPNIKALLIISNILFLGRYFIDASSFAPILADKLSTIEVEGFDDYLKLLDTESKTYSFIDQPIYLFLINSTIIFIPKMNFSMKLFSMLFIIGNIIGGYMFGNLYRSTQYFYIYLIFIVPTLVYFWNHTKNIDFRSVKRFLYCVMVLYCIYSFQKSIHNEYYIKWLDFKTVFEATHWL